MVPLREHETLWQYLKKQTRPIVLYGMGNGADARLDLRQGSRGLSGRHRAHCLC